MARLKGNRTTKAKRVPAPRPKDPFAFARRMRALACKADRGETVSLEGMDDDAILEILLSSPAAPRRVSRPH